MALKHTAALVALALGMLGWGIAEQELFRMARVTSIGIHPTDAGVVALRWALVELAIVVVSLAYAGLGLLTKRRSLSGLLVLATVVWILSVVDWVVLAQAGAIP